MEKKKQIKISFKIVLLILVIFIAIVIGFSLIQINNKTNSKDYKSVPINGKTYYQRLSQNMWNGQYHQEKFYAKNRIDDIMEVVSYEKYLDLVSSINSITSNDIENYYSNKNSNYIILSHVDSHGCEMELIDCIKKRDKLIIYGDESINGHVERRKWILYCNSN